MHAGGGAGKAGTRDDPGPGGPGLPEVAGPATLRRAGGRDSMMRLGERGRVHLLGSLASLAVVALYARGVYLPHIRYDDFDFLTTSRTWQGALENLWRPMNDHAMPMSRLAAALLMQVVGGQSAIPMAAQLQGPLAVVLGMWLLYLFVRRELGHPFYGVMAMTLWGVTTAYLQAVTWYSASFFILSLDTLLLGLLSAQAWRRSRKWHHLVLCAIWCFLAPGWFGGGILAGAWCGLYLLPLFGEERRQDQPQRSLGRWFTRERLLSVLPAAVPPAGSVAFLVVSLPNTADRIIHAGHYRGKTVFEAFQPVDGIVNTIRTLADNQVLGAFGIHPSAVFPWTAALAIFGCLSVAAAVWWRLAPGRRLLLLGLAIVLASDILTYSARADWGYERSVHNWTRYHLFPHLGLVLFVIGGLPRFQGKWFALAPSGALSRWQAAALGIVIAAALALHLPRSLQSPRYFPEQIGVLTRVEQIDAVCRAHGISAVTAREALGFLQFPLGYDGENAWDFLRGSPQPKQMTIDEARRLLLP